MEHECTLYSETYQHKIVFGVSEHETIVKVVDADKDEVITEFVALSGDVNSLATSLVNCLNGFWL